MLMVASLLFIGMQTFAQTSITGTVTDANGEPVPGANVRVKGFSDLGTITDLNGSYSLSVPAEATALVFSFVGLKMQEVEIAGQTNISVTLQNEDVGIDEVVVTALGITRDKKALGYSVQDVKADEISRSNTSDVVNSLSGKVAGVRINNSTGAAGGSTFVEIRGSSSILGNNQPLFVVDGVPISSGGGSGGIAGVAASDRTIDLNPDDIENIAVLKGGAATALYGMRAANGVILITTKKGNLRKGLNINFSSSVAFDQISQVPKLQDKYAQGSMEWSVSGRDAYLSPDDPGYNAISWGPSIDTLRYTTDPTYIPPTSGSTPMDEYMQKWDPNGRIVGMGSPYASSKAVTPYDRYAYFQTGVSYRNSINMSGGDDKTTFFFSMSNETTKGVVPNNTLGKNTFKLNASTKLNEKLKVSGNVSYMNTKGDRIQQGSNTSGVMLGLLRTPATFDNSYGWKFDDGTQRTFRNGGGYDNPYWVSNEILYQDNVNRIMSSAQIDWTITDYLSLTFRPGIDWYSRSAKNNFAVHSNTAKAGYSSSYNYFSSDFNSDVFLNFNKDLNESMNLTVTLGQNMYRRFGQSTTSEANGLIIPEYYNVANTSNNKGYESTYEYRTMAFFGDVGFSYADMLYVNLTGRYESSTTLPEKNNGFFYPSASLGFIFTELGGLKDNSVLTFGKLRASYAITANIPTAYTTKTYFVPGGAADGWTDGVSFPFNGVNGNTLSGTMGNPDLTPETTTDMEIGVNLNFFLNRLTIDAAYYKRNTEDILLYVPIAPSSGFGSRYMNAATMETTGLELLVNATAIKTADFAWDITLNWANPNTMVTELAPGVDNVFLGGFTDPQVRAVAGASYRSIYGTAWQRDDQGHLLINDNPSAMFYGYPNQAAETKKLGTVQSDWTMGFTNTFTYKGVTLSALIDIKHGGQMWNGTKGALYYFGTHGDTETRNDDYTFGNGVMGHLNADGEVVHYDTDGVTEIAGAGAANTAVVKLDENWRWWNGMGSGFTGPSEDYIEDAGWVRLREVSLAYNFKSMIGGVSWLQNLEVYFTGRNLWLSTPYTGIDPETSLLGSSNAQGFDYFNMPGTKSYIFGLKIGF